jgi:hypothetical protein
LDWEDGIGLPLLYPDCDQECVNKSELAGCVGPHPISRNCTANKIQIKNAVSITCADKPREISALSKKTAKSKQPHHLVKLNSLQSKHLEKAARKVQVSATRDLAYDPYACFVTISEAISTM